MAATVHTHHARVRHHRAHRIRTTITHAIAWTLTDHDDRAACWTQDVVWWAGLVLLVVLSGGAR